MDNILTKSFREILLKRASKIIKIKNSKEYCEDIVQNAFYILIKYHDKLNTSNYEKLINWLVTQESYRSIKLIKRSRSLYFNDFDISESFPVYEKKNFNVLNDLMFDYNILKQEFDNHQHLHILNIGQHRRRIQKEYLNNPKQAQIIVTLRNIKAQKNYDRGIEFKKRRSKKLSGSKK